MFVGRESEMETLERLYSKPGFQMVVMYGRRRVGKTALIDQFAKDRNPLYFTAQQKSSAQNLQAFSQQVYRHFSLSENVGAFVNWSAAFGFVAERASDSQDRLLFVFDEFPYAAEADPSLPSELQIAIDHTFKDCNAFIILCGSNEGFMESEVLGRKSPLYGRRTAQMKLLPFDYLDAAKMLPGATTEEKVKYYATFGGTPYYLEQIDAGLSYEENVVAQFFNISGLLYEEPLMLLRQELREPALYNSILDAMGQGATKPKAIAEKAGVATESMSKYLSTLEGLGLISKTVPFGMNSATSRKGSYSIADPLFAYWYRFVSPFADAVEAGSGKAVASSRAFGDDLSAYVGLQFERMCLQWLVRQNNEDRLPFLATNFGRWWGTDPSRHEETDIDAIAANPHEKAIVLGECKWRNTFDETTAIADLESKLPLVGNYDRAFFFLFSKHALSAGTKRKAGRRDDLFLVNADALYR